MDVQIKKYWIVILLIGFALLYATYVGSHEYWDEAVYLSNARDKVNQSYFLEDFRFPLLEYTVGFFWLFFPLSTISAQSLMIVFSLWSIWILYVLLKEEKIPTPIQIGILLLYGLMPLLLEWSFRAYGDIPSIAAMMMSIYAYIRYTKTKTSFWLYMWVAMAVVSFLFRFSTILFIIPLGIHFLSGKKDILKAILAGLLLLSPWLIFNYITYGNPLWDLTAQGSVILEYTTMQSVSEWIPALQQNFHYILLLSMIGLVTLKKKDHLPLLLASILLIHVLFHSFVVRLKLDRYILVFAPFIFFFAARGAQQLQQRLKQQGRKIIIGIFALLIIITTSHAISYHQQFVQDETCKEFYEISTQLSIPQGARVASTDWAYYGWFLNVHASATWTSNLSDLFYPIPPDYIILHKPGSIQVDYEAFATSPHLEKIQQHKVNCGREVIIYKVNTYKEITI